MDARRLFAGGALAALLAAGGAVPLGARSAGPAVSAPAPARGGTVVDGFFEEPDRLIPNTSFNAFSIMVQETLFSPLFYSDDKGALHTGLADRIPTVENGGISADGLTYTFHLRPGLKWSDGQPLDARDVDYSWRTWLNKSLIVNSTAGFDHIKGATVSPDHLSITFRLSAPYAPFLAVWVDQVMPLPAHALGKLTPKALNTSPFTSRPTVGSGPFVLTGRKSGDSITERANPYYYQRGKPYLSTLIFKIIPDQVALTNALRAHEIDCAWFLDVAQINALRRIDGYTLTPSAAPNIEQGLLNLKNPILQDGRVRQALEYGLDRPAMVKDVWHDTAVLMASDEAPTVFSYAPSVKPYPYDPARAARLLDAAGWKLGSDGLRHKNGKTLSLRYSTTSHNAWRAQDEGIALQNYRDLGIQLRIVNYPGDAYFGSILPGGNFDIGEYENGLVYDPSITIGTTFKSTAVPPRGDNWGHYINPVYDKLIAAEESTTDPRRRKAIFARMQAVMNADMPSLWLYDPPVLDAHRDALHNYAPGPFSYETWNSWNWWKG